ncbi:MAG: family 10 glycosylhydrolase [Planctomycetes bacterium]|nr:family 10 glycosylhydrolase [Planctomycetota bacterium]MCB9918334.1 family 10 glycosylhydrolase [Planctomycetota bacterium]
MPRYASSSCVAALLALTSCSFLPKSAHDIHQAVWVTRYDYGTEGDVRELVRNCARSGFDTILFQIRGNGTVAFESRIEPWLEQFSFRRPGFDPLAVACDEARNQGIRLHAWINALPGWRGTSAPASEWQLYNTHPDWFLVDQYHDRQPLLVSGAPAYVWLNPCLPEVREHVARICEEVAQNYEVDGIHLDYCRMPEAGEVSREGKKTSGGAPLDYPYDNRTLEYFREATGKNPDDDRASWNAWRSSQVTELVREVRRRVGSVRRRAVVSAAVFPTPAKASAVLQDWPTWLASGYVDAVFPMTYSADDGEFRERIAVQHATTDRPIIVGIGVYKHDNPAQTLRQIKAVRDEGLQGFALYSYASLYGTKENRGGEPVEASLRASRRDALLPVLQSGRFLGDGLRAGPTTSLEQR